MLGKQEVYLFFCLSGRGGGGVYMCVSRFSKLVFEIMIKIAIELYCYCGCDCSYDYDYACYCN